MTVFEDIKKYCKVNSDEFNTVPKSFTCGEIIDYNTGQFKGIEINGYWDIVEPDPYITKPDSEEPKEIESVKRKRFVLSESEPLYHTIKNKTSDLRSKINLSGDSKIHNMSIRVNKKESEEYQFYTTKDSKYSSFSLIQNHRNITDEVSERIRTYVKKELQKLDNDILDKQIVQIECAFEDFLECELLNLRGHVVTPNPHRYYSDVESVESYARAITDTDEEYEKLIEKDNYHVFYRLDVLKDKNNESFEEAKSLINPIMKNLMNSIISVDGEYKLEAESIIIKNYNEYQEYNTEEDILSGYDEKDNKENIYFFVMQPFNSF